jgi:hypothetical protein
VRDRPYYVFTEDGEQMGAPHATLDAALSFAEAEAKETEEPLQIFKLVAEVAPVTSMEVIKYE